MERTRAREALSGMPAKSAPQSSADHRQGARARCAADAARALCAPNRGRRFVMAITSVRVASGGDGRAPAYHKPPAFAASARQASQ